MHTDFKPPYYRILCHIYLHQIYPPVRHSNNDTLELLPSLGLLGVYRVACTNPTFESIWATNAPMLLKHDTSLDIWPPWIAVWPVLSVRWGKRYSIKEQHKWPKYLVGTIVSQLGPHYTDGLWAEKVQEFCTNKSTAPTMSHQWRSPKNVLYECRNASPLATSGRQPIHNLWTHSCSWIREW